MMWTYSIYDKKLHTPYSMYQVTESTIFSEHINQYKVKCVISAPLATPIRTAKITTFFSNKF